MNLQNVNNKVEFCATTKTSTQPESPILPTGVFHGVKIKALPDDYTQNPTDKDPRQPKSLSQIQINKDTHIIDDRRAGQLWNKEILVAEDFTQTDDNHAAGESLNSYFEKIEMDPNHMKALKERLFAPNLTEEEINEHTKAFLCINHNGRQSDPIAHDIETKDMMAEVLLAGRVEKFKKEEGLVSSEKKDLQRSGCTIT